jgi:dolichyl-phosphate beta-glucosyltransferase
MSKSGLISIIIPSYNEAERLPSTLTENIAFCERNYSDRYEIIVVDDGSFDATAEYVNSVLEKNSSINLISYKENVGKGHAVKCGVLAAKGDYILISDADGSTPINQLELFIECMDNGVDIVVASRNIDEKLVAMSFFRTLLSKLFSRLVNILLVDVVSDPQCGFKLFNAKSASKIFALLKEKKWAWDMEAILIAVKNGYKIKELPVQWEEKAGSKIHPFRDAFYMLFAIFRIKIRYL